LSGVSHGHVAVDIAVVHGGVIIYRLSGPDPSIVWSFTTCTECAMRPAGAAVPHAFDVRCLPNPNRLDLETGDEAARASSIDQILRYGTEAGAIAATRCEERSYMLDFAVPFDTPGGYVRALFALYDLPRVVADAFLADLSQAIRSGRRDLLVSEERAVANALDVAFAATECDETHHAALQTDLCNLLTNGS
jgi:hypothetical protein